MFKKVKDKPYYTNNHSCFLLTVHMVLVTKYRKPVLQGKVGDYVYALIKETMESENIIIREMNGEADRCRNIRRKKKRSDNSFGAIW